MFPSSVVGLYSISDRVPDKLQTRVRGFSEWSRTYAGRDGAEPDARPLYGALCVITVCHRAALLESAMTTRDDYRLAIRWVFAQFSKGLCNPSIRAPRRKVMRRADLDIFLRVNIHLLLIPVTQQAKRESLYVAFLYFHVTEGRTESWAVTSLTPGGNCHRSNADMDTDKT